MAEAQIIGAALPIAIFLLMLGIGHALSAADLRDAIRSPVPVLIGLGSLIVVSPIVGLGIASVAALPAAFAIGLVLVASCPGGLFSNYLTLQADGRTALSVVLTVFGTLLYLVTGPFWSSIAVQWFTGANVNARVNSAELLMSLGLFLLLPVVLGMAARHFGGVGVSRLAAITRDVGAIAAIFVYCIIVYQQRSSFIGDAMEVLPAVLALNVSALVSAALLCRLSRIDRKRSIAVFFEHLVRQEGTGIYVATVSLALPQAAIPLLVNTLVGTSASVAFILWCRVRGRK